MLKSRMNVKQMILLFCLCFICSNITACDGVDKNGSRISDDGRSYGGLIQGETGKKIKTAFFDVKVEDAVKYDTYQFDDGLYQAEEGNTYLVVTLTIENTYEESIPMSITDFVLDYEGNESTDIITGYGKADLNQDSFMDNLFTLQEGESVTKSILFTVKNSNEYSLKYSEYYEDAFKGDTYEIILEPDNATIESTNTTEQISTNEDNPSAE